MAHSRLDLALERDSDVPLGTQLAWKLRAAIASGALRGGDRLPPVRELASEARVNVNTVRAVYARLAKQGVIVSEHGRGTFVSGAGGGAARLGELVERAAQDARRNAVDPRDLAAMLYAGFDAPPAAGAGELDAEVEARRALRTEIEALEHDLARLEPGFVPGGGPAARGRQAGARLVSARELEATRDALAERVAARLREQRSARAVAKAAPAPRAAEPPADRPSAWPELLPLAPPGLAT